MDGKNQSLKIYEILIFWFFMVFQWFFYGFLIVFHGFFMVFFLLVHLHKQDIENTIMIQNGKHTDVQYNTLSIKGGFHDITKSQL